MDRENVWKTYKPEDLDELERISRSYKECLDEGKTERECVKVAVRMLEEKGFRRLDQIIENKERLQAGDGVYAVCMEKSVAAFRIGTEPLERGMNILGAHIDSPRIDETEPAL